MQSFASSANFLVDKKKGPSGPFLMMNHSQLTELVEVIKILLLVLFEAHRKIHRLKVLS